MKTAEEVFQQLVKVINQLRGKYEGIKIILCEITPRGDVRDDEVIRINQIIAEYSQDKVYIFLAKHGNLRTEDKRHFSDNKHISFNAAPIFVSNIKRALRLAYGTVKPNVRGGSYNYRRNSNPYNNQQNNNTDIVNFKIEMRNILQQINEKMAYNPPWHLYDRIT